MAYKDAWSSVIRDHWDSCCAFIDLTRGYYQDLSKYGLTLYRYTPTSKPYDHWVNTPIGPGLHFDANKLAGTSYTESIYTQGHVSSKLLSEGTLIGFLHSDKYSLMTKTAALSEDYGAGIMERWSFGDGGWMFFVYDDCLYLDSYSPTSEYAMAISEPIINSGHVSSLATTFVAGDYPLGFVNGNMHDVAVQTFAPLEVPDWEPGIVFGNESIYYKSMLATTWQGFLVFNEVLTPDEMLQLHRDHLLRAYSTNYINAPFCPSEPG